MLKTQVIANDLERKSKSTKHPAAKMLALALDSTS